MEKGKKQKQKIEKWRKQKRQRRKQKRKKKKQKTKKMKRKFTLNNCKRCLKNQILENKREMKERYWK